MKISFMTLIIAGAVVGTLPMAAAAQHVPRIVIMTPSVGFSGGYVGFGLNRDSGSIDMNGETGDQAQQLLGTRSLGEPSGLGLNLRAGYDWRAGNTIFGVWGEIAQSWAKDDVVIPAVSDTWSVGFGTSTAAMLRLGYDMGGVMVYSNAGYRWTDVELETFSGAYSDRSGGISYGVGIETEFSHHMSGYLEFHRNTGKVDIEGLTADLSLNTFTLGVNYKF